jgi:hypothetical protein
VAILVQIQTPSNIVEFDTKALIKVIVYAAMLAAGLILALALAVFVVSLLAHFVLVLLTWATTQADHSGLFTQGLLLLVVGSPLYRGGKCVLRWIRAFLSR